MKDAGDFVTDFHLSFEPMQALGWQVEVVAWRDEQDWNDYDAVYICAPWDYPGHAAEFLGVLNAIDASKALLLNDLITVRWNLDKHYLRDVAARGDDIVPSSWHSHLDGADVPLFFEQHNSDKLVIKPTVGANALDTFVLQKPVASDLLKTLLSTFDQRAFIVQPFIENIQKEGEFSLFFFNGEYSHAILKKPESGDFRVQEEHGAEISATVVPDELQRVAESVFSHLNPTPVYGRGDWVRGADGRFLLMELELIEPSLYLRTDSGAAGRFARAFDQRFEEFSSK